MTRRRHDRWCADGRVRVRASGGGRRGSSRRSHRRCTIPAEGGREMTTRMEKSIQVDVPLSTAYNQWTQFEDFPHFMGGVQEVRQLDDRRLHWVAEIAGVRREWDASILEQEPDRKVAWAATSGATNAGAVRFEAAGPC